MTDARVGRVAVRALVSPHPDARVGRVAVRTLRRRDVTAVGRVSVRTLIAPPAPPTADPDPRFWTHRLAATLGLDPVGDQPIVELHTRAPGATVWTHDTTMSTALRGYTINHGRRDARSRPDAATASLELVTAFMPAALELGTGVRVQLCDAVATELGLTGEDHIRFTGEVTDTATRHRQRVTAVVAAGRSGRLGRLGVDVTGWPAEPDTDRVERILDAVGLDTGDMGADGPTLAAPTQPAGARALLDMVATSSGGVVLEQPDGAVDYQGPEYRRGRTPAVTLDAGDVLSEVSWEQHVATVVNDVTVSTAAGVLVRVTDPFSADPVTGYGPYPTAVSTELVSADLARELGTLLVGRYARPAWQLPALVATDRTVTTDQRAGLLRLRCGDRLELTDLPAACPVPGVVIVEGWTETAAPRRWALAVAVSDPVLSGVAVRWIDVPNTDAYQWQDVDPDVTWWDLTRVEDPGGLL